MSNPSPLRNYSKTLSPDISSKNEERCLKKEIPDLLKINCKNHMMNQILDTSILDGVVSTNKYARFSLDRGRGILHSNSKVQLCMKRIGAAADDAKGIFFPWSTGIASTIDKAILRSGTTVLATSQDFSHWFAMKGLLDTNEDVKNRYSVEDGRTNAFQLVTAMDATAGVIDNGTQARSAIIYDNGTEMSEDVAFGAASTTVTNKNLTSRTNQQLKNNSEFVLALSDLFPALREFSLPLFMTDEVVIIELFFKTNQQQVRCVRSGDAVTDVYEIDPTKTKMICDYITYDQKTMEEFANANQNMELTFSDPVLVKAQNNFSTGTNPFTTNLGGSGRIVDQVLCSFAFRDDADLSNVTPLNNYLSVDLTTGAASTEQIDFNLRVNDRLLFPLDVSNSSEQYNNLVLSQGRPVNITATEYVKGGFGNPFSTYYTLEGYTPVNHSQGLKRYLGVRNSRPEERINNSGIQLQLNVTGAVNENVVMRAWVFVRRSIAFDKGRFRIIDV